MFVFVVYMAAMFAAVFTAFDIAADYESGFGHRMMLAAPRRLAIVGGYLTVSLWRGLLNVVVVFAIALATGMPVKGDALDIAALIVLALLLDIATTLYGAGIALRFQSTASGVLILIPTFMLFFLSPSLSPATSSPAGCATPPTPTRSPRCWKPGGASSPTIRSRSRSRSRRSSG